MTSSSQSASGAETDPRVAASVDAWKRALLDLSKRNRALHFRAYRVSTIALVDELPWEAFRNLYLRERAMRFRAVPERRSEGEEQTAESLPPRADSADADVVLEDGPQLDFVPYDEAAVDERHTDDWLQTASSVEALDTSLRRLDEQSKSSVEEQGVNTLFLALGMLHYTEAAQSEQVFQAPLVLLPVQLTRTSARSGYVLRAGDDEPVVNPALAEYLRRQYGIALPELPDAASIPDDYDLQSLFGAVTALVAEKTAWRVKSSAYLGLFSFQKLAMYKDLELNSAALAIHRLIRQLVSRAPGAAGDAVVGLPDEIRALDLDRDYPPESTYQVVDADSSQLRAIAAVARQHDLVIEGPPGTGKSQTITNLIAQALAAGKSVLFVAEKMAALKVVHDRLVRAGLGEFCLELHSTKSNKRAVMQELGTSLDASLQRLVTPTISTQRLPLVRTTLAEYVSAVHEPFGSLGISPWLAYGHLGRVLAAPRIAYTGRAEDGVSQEILDRTKRDLRDLAVAAADVGVPAEHPWRDAAKTFYSAADLEAIDDEVRALSERLAAVVRQSAVVEASLGLPPLRTLVDADNAVAIAQVVGRSPGAPVGVLDSAAWNAPPAEATGLIQRGRDLGGLERRVFARLAEAVLEQEHADDIAYVERKASGIFGFLALLDGRFRSIKRRWIGYRLPSFTGSLLDQAADMRLADRVRAERAQLDAVAANAQALFGGHWRGWRSDWDALGQYLDWVVEFRQLCVRHGLSGRTLTVASQKTPDTSAIRDLATATAAARDALAALRGLVGWPDAYLAAEPIATIEARAGALAEHLRDAPKWAAFEAARVTASGSLAKDLLPFAIRGDVRFDDLELAFLRAFWLKWTSSVVRARPALERFHTMTHEQRVTEFRELDQRVLVENRLRLVSELRERVQQRLREGDAAEAMGHLRRELSRQRGLSPLRRTMKLSGPAIRAIKPCFMMSPLTVAQLLEGGAPSFDLVIFDEASQLPPEDAAGAVSRARQLVVVGDPKQLPPTDFFAVSSGMASAPLDAEGVPTFVDAESILEQFMGAGVPMSRLKWHYRSAHESLISFSNVQFYDSDLYTFPSVERGTDTNGLQFEHVAAGVYEGKGLNAVEARRVADEVVVFAREELARRAAGQTRRSLGVGTFNMRQQLAIQDELERRRRDDPSIEPFFDRASEEPFFVKNLENIQGDERDVIFLSVTYARSPDGKLRYHFGPLNGENGWRRLNVLTTRARQRMRVFSSIRGDDISVADTTARGAALLRSFLLFAERGRTESAFASVLEDAGSPFERDVLLELQRLGMRVIPQVGEAGYRIDLGIVDDAVPGRFVCGIECDGVAYHSSESARDRDRLRQQVLEARGWTIHRVWSTDWFKDRAGQIERLARLVEESRVRARDAAAAERTVQERESREAADRQVQQEASAREFVSQVSEAPAVPYARPTAPPYVMAPGAGRFAARDLLVEPVSQLVRAVVEVAAVESPVHEADVVSRIAGMWSSRAGSRIQARIHEACEAAARERLVVRRGAFLWSSGTSCTVRSRAGTRIPGDRIAPEEYEQAILAVLRDGHGFARTQLQNEVRSVLGFARTGATLDEAIGAVIARMLGDGRLGEGSMGIRLRA